MTYTIPQAIAQANRAFFLVQGGGGLSPQFDHRGMVLRSVCDLEAEFAQLLIAFFQRRNPSVSQIRAQKELFSENAMLSSLSRMVRLGGYLGLIDEDESHDLRIFAKLRNMYAHGRERGQFHLDGAAAALLKQLRLYATSVSVLQGFDDQAIFLSSYEFLKKQLHERAASVRDNAG